MATSELIRGLGERLNGARGVSDDTSADPADAPDPDPADLLPPDPKPGRKARSAGRVRPSAPKATVAQKRTVADALTMMITMPAGIVSLRDPVCGNAVLDQADAIVDRLVPIVCRNPAMLTWFTEGAAYMDWIALMGALAPVFKTVWSHHVTRSLEHEEGTGGQLDQADFNAYTAPVFAAA
jgi:hypothetical protein